MYAAFIVSALAATVAAVPQLLDVNADVEANINAREVYATWPATKFVKACTESSCTGSFSVSAPANYVAGAPAFTVECKPQKDFVDCTGDKGAATVQSKWVEGSSTEAAEITVQHVWTEGQQRSTASGSARADAGATEFKLTVDQLTKVL
ncbi:hypothetical protein F5B20DRAFT_575086 [Whalleya microplaca]|nr:hypothetical protein F5B20DRAFT_575086 [Whalleya microplaca]